MSALAADPPMSPELQDTFARAMDQAISEGKGWKDAAEKQAYLDRINDDDNLPALFCTTQEEFERSPEALAFSQLVYTGETPESLMMKFKDDGNKSFALGKQNLAKNIQYYRDAINHYTEALVWGNKVVASDAPASTTPPPLVPNVVKQKLKSELKTLPPVEVPSLPTSDNSYSQLELAAFVSTVTANRAMAHMQLKNWGYVISDCKLALSFNASNIKAIFRLSKAHQARQEWEVALEVAEKGLSLPNEDKNKDLLKVVKEVGKNATLARVQRQKKERAKAERVGNIKRLWKYTKSKSISVGRVPLISTIDDDDMENVGDDIWGYHHPHSGKLPKIETAESENSWPVMFVYPSHRQSDFVEKFVETSMLAEQLADMFPEEGPRAEWDFEECFVCSDLAIYFEVHVLPEDESDGVVYWESVEKLTTMAATMQFFENSRAMKGDDGLDAAEKAKVAERKRLHAVRKKWGEKRGKWSKPELPALVRVHPAMTLTDCITDKRFVVTNFIPSFFIFPEEHPGHEDFLKGRKVLGLAQPTESK